MSHTQATFLVDYFFPLWPAAALIAWLYRRGTLPVFRWLPRPMRVYAPSVADRHRAALVTVAFLATAFILGAEVPCYFDLMPPPPWITAQATCNEFMWHGYVAWPFGKPPIPSYKEWWSTPWLIAAFGSQVASCLAIVSLVVFRKRT